MRLIRLVTASLLVVPAVLAAQRSPSADSIPHAGEWAAEVVLGPSFTGASLLRFTSPRAALLLGADASVTRSKQESSGGFPNPPSFTRSTFNGRIGLRRYRSSSNEHLLPLIGGGVRGGYMRESSNLRGWNAGAYGEFGAVYLVASHVSLGATGEVSVIRSTSKLTSNGVTSTATATSVGASLVRLLASVYF